MQFDKLNRDIVPDMDMLEAYASTPLWGALVTHLKKAYAARTDIEYSGCSVPGWNVKFKKAGRSLTTLYPMAGYFIALIVIGSREKEEAELLLPSCTEYTNTLYRSTKEGMGQRWLMLEVRDEAVLEDVKKLAALRRNAAKVRKT